MIRTFIILSIVLISCISAHKIPSVSLTNKYVTYNKVKVKIDSKNFGNITLRGHISIIRDSLICFNFWGPLGYKMISGKFGEHFKLIDRYNDREYTDILSLLVNESGLIFNRSCVEDILLARVDSLINVLSDLNKDVVQLMKEVKKQDQFLTILNKSGRNNFSLEFLYHRSNPKIIKINYKGSLENWIVIIEIVSMSNEQKYCNFDF